jgi:hypothetical protein
LLLSFRIQKYQFITHHHLLSVLEFLGFPEIKKKLNKGLQILCVGFLTVDPRAPGAPCNPRGPKSPLSPFSPSKPCVPSLPGRPLNPSFPSTPASPRSPKNKSEGCQQPKCTSMQELLHFLRSSLSSCFCLRVNALPTGHVLNVSVKMGQFMLSGCAREVFKEFHLDRAITPRTPEPFFSFWAQH